MFHQTDMTNLIEIHLYNSTTEKLLCMKMLVYSRMKAFIDQLGTMNLLLIQGFNHQKSWTTINQELMIQRKLKLSNESGKVLIPNIMEEKTL